MKPYEQLGQGGQFRRMRAVAEVALLDYDLPPGKLRPLAHIENTTFRLDTEDGARYVLRIHRVTGSPGHPVLDQQAIRSEMIWLAALRRDTDVVAPEPVATRTGDLLTVASAAGVPGERICVLFRWVDGRFVDSGLTVRHLEGVGRLAAKMHLHAEQFDPPAGFWRRQVHDLSPEVRRYMIAECAEHVSPQAGDAAAKLLDRLDEITAQLGRGREQYGLIHADLHQWNYLFSGYEARAIDFDDCGFANFIYDFGVTLFELEEHDNAAELGAALLRGYRTLRPLPQEHERYLPAFVAFRRLQIALWHVEQRHHPAFTEWAEDAAQMMAGVQEFVAA